MRILFLSRWYPFPPSNGSKLRIFNLLQGLTRCHQVTLLSFCEGPVSPPPPLWQERLQAIHQVPYRPFDPRRWRARLGLLSPRPRSVLDTFSPAMDQAIRQELATGDYDLVIASQIDMAAYRDSFGPIPALLEEVEVGVMYERMARAEGWRRRLRARLTWAKYRRYLNGLCRRFRLCTVASAEEQRLLVQTLTAALPIEVVPNCIDLADYGEAASDGLRHREPHTLIFTGSLTFEPNYDAMVWFVGEILPRIRQAVPDARLVITGDHGDRPLPATPGVVRTGMVDDVRRRIARAAVSVVPIRAGGGTRLKILEAMALQTPVVSTRKGAEGLAMAHGRELLLADTPQAFAEQVIALLRQPDQGRTLAAHAYRHVRATYDTAVVLPRFLSLVEQAAQGGGRESHR